MSVPKINPDIYVGNTGKQLKDIETNSTNISNLTTKVNTNSTNITNLTTRVTNLENVEWRRVYSTRKSISLTAWNAFLINDMQDGGGKGSTYLEANKAGIKVKKACTVLVYIQGTMNLPVADCGIRIFQNSTQKFENYNRGTGSWTFLNCFGVLDCSANDIIRLAYMCGNGGSREYLESTSIFAVVIK